MAPVTDQSDERRVGIPVSRTNTIARSAAMERDVKWTGVWAQKEGKGRAHGNESRAEKDASCSTTSRGCCISCR